MDRGFVSTQNKRLRTAAHTDRDGDLSESQTVGEALDRIDDDPGYSLGRGLVVSSESNEERTLQDLRDERYVITLAQEGLNPVFASLDEAREKADIEKAGAEWRVRVQASMMALDLIIGGDDAWQEFARGIVAEQHMPLISMVNRVVPEIQTLQERIAKGDPRELRPEDIQAIDAILERVWGTLKISDDDPLPYKPPYQNWLEVVLPILRLLDPGKKDGVEYTQFEPPIQIRRTPYRLPTKTLPTNDPFDDKGFYIPKEKYNKDKDNLNYY